MNTKTRHLVETFFSGENLVTSLIGVFAFTLVYVVTINFVPTFFSPIHLVIVMTLGALSGSLFLLRLVAKSYF